jgi:hypothetical protein
LHQMQCRKITLRPQKVTFRPRRIGVEAGACRGFWPGRKSTLVDHGSSMRRSEK